MICGKSSKQVALKAPDAKSFKTDFVKNLVAGLVIGLGVGLIAGLGVSLGVGLGVGLGAGLGLVIGLGTGFVEAFRAPLVPVGFILLIVIILAEILFWFSKARPKKDEKVSR